MTESEMVDDNRVMEILAINEAQLNALVSEGELRAFKGVERKFRRADANTLATCIDDLDPANEDGRRIRRILNRVIKPQAQAGGEPTLAPIPI